jgi:hypothetical protein
MLTFRINLYCPKAYPRPDHSIRISEYHTEKLLLLLCFPQSYSIITVTIHILDTNYI